MKRRRTTAAALAAAALALVPTSAFAQAGHNHIKHVAESFRGTPNEAGLLATAVVEAEIARQHARLAAGEEELAAIQRHVGHVVHAVRPAEGERGPGQGYGLLRAAEGVVAHVGMAAEAEGASGPLKRHAEHVMAATRNVVAWAENVLEKAEAVATATDADAAHGLAEEIVAALDAVVEGTDADGNGTVSWGEGEGGLTQAIDHLELLMKAEGIGG